MSTLRIEINRKLCMGAGECVYSAPASFELDEEGKAVVLDAGGDVAALRTAMEGCPNFAIRILPASGQRQTQVSSE